MFTYADLDQLMRESVGVEDDVVIDASIADLPLEELGYDSLSRLELATQVGQVLGARVPDEAVDTLVTPRAIVDYINAAALEGVA